MFLEQSSTSLPNRHMCVYRLKCIYNFTTCLTHFVCVARINIERVLRTEAHGFQTNSMSPLAIQ